MWYAKWFEEFYGTNRGAELNIKTESQLQKSDFNNNFCILGPIASFSHWKKFDIPIKKWRRGFKIGKYSFKNPSHGFSYISPSETSPFRLVISGNSIQSFEQMTYKFSLGFEFVVFNDDIPVFIGNGSHDTELNALRESLYIPVESKYFAFMISRSLMEDEKDIDAEIEKCDHHIEVFVEKMKLDLPQTKIKMFIHATQKDIKYFTGYFDDLCDDGIISGRVVGDETHSWKWEAIEHESIHHIFNHQVNEVPATFLCEGVPMWYENTKNAEIKRISLQRAIEFVDYDLTDVICGKENFYQGDKYYLISGMFTEYLIDTYGLNKFLELYRHERRDLLYGFEKIYNKPLSEILQEYREWLSGRIVL